ncbi:hypothetical protein F3I16_15070 [Pseudomonas sp. L-22-4S-12]|uniref:hypothetical protein n=1 Tax=Pseudomonas sp. L-22-4S-12 TaxID=2610893 RepID=UPI001323F41B|nr:hypothetical protein [Pseudomonas sp. L-22-4S-12]MWV17363.1 hypothetical protein [Pseudomonas sp. L-22-4S-12]
MKQANPCNLGTVQPPPADLSEQAPGASTPVPQAQGKPMLGNVAEPPVRNAPLTDLRSGKGDRRVNPSRRTE